MAVDHVPHDDEMSWYGLNGTMVPVALWIFEYRKTLRQQG